MTLRERLSRLIALVGLFSVALTLLALASFTLWDAISITVEALQAWGL